MDRIFKAFKVGDHENGREAFDSLLRKAAKPAKVTKSTDQQKDIWAKAIATEFGETLVMLSKE